MVTLVARYYVHPSTHAETPCEFADVETIVAFLRDSGREDGELYIKNIDGIKIKYNVKTGIVKAVSAESISGITNIYSKNAFSYLLIPVYEAICIFAKINLLMQLYQLHDKEISALIAKKHLPPPGNNFINTKQRAVNKTLMKLKKLTRPFFRIKKKNNVQKAVYHTLVHFGIENIHADKDIIIIMETIQKKIHSGHLP